MSLLTTSIHFCIHESRICTITIHLGDKKYVLESCSNCKNKLEKLEKFGIFKIISEVHSH